MHCELLPVLGEEDISLYLACCECDLMSILSSNGTVFTQQIPILEEIKRKLNSNTERDASGDSRLCVCPETGRLWVRPEAKSYQRL